MDVRVTRRSAEKAARDLVGERAGLVGELGVAHGERSRLSEAVDGAATAGRELIAAAETEAARLIALAHDGLADGEARYATARAAAVEGGWPTGDLTALGYPAAKNRRVPPATEPTVVNESQPEEGADSGRTAPAP